MHTTRASLLIRLKNRHDEAAWREFDTIYRPMLARFAAAYGAQPAEAEDVVQHCMSALHEHIGSFDYDPSKGRFKGWLKTLVNNRIRNLVRKRRERIARTGEFNAIQAEEESPDVMFERIWMDEHLKYCLAEVRREVEDKTFRAFLYYVIEERPVEEICRELGMNANQVHKSKYRITKKLSERMALVTGAS